MAEKLELARLPRFAQWLALLAASILISVLLEFAGLPAALFLGPMIAAILFQLAGGALSVPKLPYMASQAVIGCLIAAAITPAILATVAGRWPLFLGVVLAIIVASNILGLIVTRLKVLPGTTAIWGLSPGGALIMVLMAEANGADYRLVAFMQYLRVVMVALAASVVARLWVGASGQDIPAAVWFPVLQFGPFAQTLALAAIGGVVGKLSRMPAGVMLVPMIAGAALHGYELIEIQLPPWLLVCAYAFVGWKIGLNFTRPILTHALRTLPLTFACNLAIILFGAGLAWFLVETVDIEPLTAYLATSPGGLDSVAIIAASSPVDLAFVMAIQAVRFGLILVMGPSVSRFVANRMARNEAVADDRQSPG